MAPWQQILLIAYGVVVFIAFVRHFVLSYAMRGVPFLTPQSPRLPGRDLPTASILVPAKDEAHGIENCLCSLLAQDYPNFEILVVDDRSKDGTPEIVERLAKTTDKLRLIRIENLPPGWTGKTHALHVCQQEARGQWLLFVDADTQLHPSCLSVVLADAVQHDAGLESLLPSLQASTFWERVVQPFAGVCLMVLYPLHKINDPDAKGMGFANGQFILIRRDVYDAIGGHEAVRDKFVEDIHIGRKVRESGVGLRVAMGRDVASVRMYASLAEMIRGWSRILYSAVDFRPAKLYALFLATVVFSVSHYAILVIGGAAILAGWRSPFLLWLFGLGVVHQLLQATLMYRIYGFAGSDRRYLAFRFLAVGVMLWVFARTIRMCRTHAVVGRGTVYGKEIQSAGKA